MQRVQHVSQSVVPRGERQQLLFGTGPLQTQRFKAPKGKKIYVPVRVEPKVFFAAERTFLGWVSIKFGLLLSVPCMLTP